MTKYTMTVSTYSRTDSGKSWRSKPDEVEAKEISQGQYERQTSKGTQQWFRRLGGSETAQRSYTSSGYIITRLTSCSPDREIKKVREFSPSK